MAIRKHAMTKEGAIVCIVREQVKKLNHKDIKGIRKTFINIYMELKNSQVEELYKKTFDVELEIIKIKKDGK
jgi:hypothetical protein|tara:strand:+ start:1304 stop:1519 length:216 start_codon:yes stop_codon:yes gene_type:complete